MAERKVISKYYPPDFDPSKVIRVRKKKQQGPKQYKVRMMMPMSATCNTCGEYIYRGKKFNCRKETVEGDDYLGIKKFRFYMRCPACAAEFVIMTDPKNADYTVEMGAKRQTEPWKQTDKEKEKLKRDREDEEAGDAMKVLENQQTDSKREMDQLDALEEIKALNVRQVKLTSDHMLQLRRQEEQLLEAEDELLIQQRFDGGVKRLRVEDEGGAPPPLLLSEAKIQVVTDQPKKQRASLVITAKKKKKPSNTNKKQAVKKAAPKVDALAFDY